LIETDELARWVRSLPTIGRNAGEPAEAPRPSGDRNPRDHA
jgi:hypothetical protein